MKLQNRPSHRGVPVGRERDWIPVTTLSVPTVWMATPDGLVCCLDLVAVELAVNGRRNGWKLTAPEAAYAADLLRQRCQGIEHHTIAKLLGVDYRALDRWFPSADTPLHDALSRARDQGLTEAARKAALKAPPKPLARCGTYQAARRHKRNREPVDELCRKARRAADRHYKQHKTYIGAPEFFE
ncbi:hypothetical protein GCM10010372_31010 [Streptomyces tauricus]|uniref:hypothetical protein n=1 Tax=Streptomyces tauricus TaxID=68274 RepID=UPI001678B9DD|nr:hypothetical protein [Streptomyces tauricus]GHA28922.1 hypothetical protein GCM10010372_31010 [Streptomyces tauricus]